MPKAIIKLLYSLTILSILLSNNLHLSQAKKCLPFGPSYFWNGLKNRLFRRNQNPSPTKTNRNKCTYESVINPKDPKESGYGIKRATDVQTLNDMPKSPVIDNIDDQKNIKTPRVTVPRPVEDIDDYLAEINEKYASDQDEAADNLIMLAGKMISEKKKSSHSISTDSDDDKNKLKDDVNDYTMVDYDAFTIQKNIQLHKLTAVNYRQQAKQYREDAKDARDKAKLKAKSKKLSLAGFSKSEATQASKTSKTQTDTDDEDSDVQSSTRAPSSSDTIDLFSKSSEAHSRSASTQSDKSDNDKAPSTDEPNSKSIIRASSSSAFQTLSNKQDIREIRNHIITVNQVRVKDDKEKEPKYILSDSVDTNTFRILSASKMNDLNIEPNGSDSSSDLGIIKDTIGRWSNSLLDRVGTERPTKVTVLNFENFLNQNEDRYAYQKFINSYIIQSQSHKSDIKSEDTATISEDSIPLSEGVKLISNGIIRKYVEKAINKYDFYDDIQGESYTNVLKKYGMKWIFVIVNPKEANKNQIEIDQFKIEQKTTSFTITHDVEIVVDDFLGQKLMYEAVTGVEIKKDKK